MGIFSYFFDGLERDTWVLHEDLEQGSYFPLRHQPLPRQHTATPPYCGALARESQNETNRLKEH